MKKLSVSRRAAQWIRLLRWGGLGVMLAGIPVTLLSGWPGYGLLVLGCVLFIAGTVWAARLYRCPRCGRQMFGRESGLNPTPYRHCPDCGWETEIEWTD